MKKLLTKILGSCLGFAMAIGIGAAVANNRDDVRRVDAAATDWTNNPVTALNQLNETDYFIIATNNGSNYLNQSISSSGHFSTTAISDSNPASTSALGVFKLIAISDKSNTYKIQSQNNSKFVTATAAKSGSASMANSDSYGWTFTYSSGFNARYQETNKQAYLRSYNNSDFRTYANTSSGAVFKIFKYAPTYSVTKNATNCTIAGDTSISPSADAVYTITHSTNYNAPTSVTVTRGGNAFNEYTYSVNNNVGTLTISKVQITGNFAITAAGIVTHSVTGTITNGSLSPTSRVATGADYKGYITPKSSSYGYPESASNITVTMGGVTLSTDDYDYDASEDGYIYIPGVTGDLVITATCPLAVEEYTITVSVTNGTYTGDSTILEGNNASVTISASSGYKLPSTVSVSGASYTYSDGVISLSNPTGNVTISATCPALATYAISVTETQGTHTGPTSIQENGSATLTFTPTQGWGQPNDVTVTGATKSWNNGTGVLTLTNPTANVSVTYSAVENELSSITLSTASGSYTLGDAFVKPTVTAHYTVASDKNVTNDATYSGYNPYVTGEQTVTISYTEGGINKITTYTATVSAKSIGYVYNKISSVSDIEDGDYLISYSTYGFDARDAANGYTTISDSSSIAHTAAMGKLAVHITKITTGDDAGKFTLCVSSTSDDNAGKYISFTTNSNGITFGNTAKAISISLATSSTHFTYQSGGKFAIGDNSTVLSFNANSNQYRYRFYKTSTTSDSTNGTNYFAVDLYKKALSGTASLIRIVCDSSIDAETGYKGGDKYIGDKIRTTDFVVKKQMDTSTSLETITDFTINNGSEVTLTETSNTITIGYGGKTAEVVVIATEREAELTSVTLNVGEDAKLDGYVAWSGAEWDLSDITVVYDWTDDDFDEEVNLQDLIDSGDATISPSTPTLGATSFTVTYEYLDVDISNGTVTLDEAVVADYVSSVSWTEKSKTHFKAFSGNQLTAATVSSWTVKATYAGAGESNKLDFGTAANQFTIKVGSKTVNSLPYTWQTEDDGEYIAVIVGGVAKEDHTNAVANICASINTIDHEKTVSGEQTLSNFIDTSSDTWKVNKAGVSGGGSNSELDIDNADFSVESTNGYWTGSQIRSYSGSTLTISSSHTIKSISFTFSGSNTGGLNTSYSSINATSKVFSSLSSQARITCISITFIGETTTTVHYANQSVNFDLQKAVVKYAKAFNAAMSAENVCSGTFENLSAGWAAASAAYTTFLSDISGYTEDEQTTAKEMLTYASARWGDNTEAACIERAMKTYEHVVRTYKLTAFMSTVRPVTQSRITSLFSIATNSSLASIIAVLSMISIAAVGGYFFLRKRKED